MSSRRKRFVINFANDAKSSIVSDPACEQHAAGVLLLMVCVCVLGGGGADADGLSVCVWGGGVGWGGCGWEEGEEEPPLIPQSA